MLTTTQSFYDNSVFKYRSVKSSVKIDVYDETIKDDVSSVSVNESKYFYNTQTYNDTLYSTRYATGEENEISLDGNTTLLPNTLTNEEIGWWSVMSDEDGLFETNPTITFQTSSTHSSIGITCCYDDFSYPLKAKCYWYNGSTLLSSLEIEQSEPSQTFDKAVSGYNKIVIEIEEAKPYSYVKLGEIQFGVIKTFDGAKLQGMNTKEYTSIMSNEVKPNELTVEIIDYDGLYNVFNPTQLIRYFRAGQKCYAQAGVLNRETSEYEYISMGNYYIESADMEDGILTIKAYGLLNLLNAQTFYSPFYTNTSVSDIIEDILDGYEYYINPNVKDITLSGYIPLTSKKEALKYVAIASGAVIKEGRDGKLYIYQATPEFSTNQIITEDTVYEGWSNAGQIIAGNMNLYSDVEALPYIFTVTRSQRLGDIKTSMIGFYNRCDVVYKTYTQGSSETLFSDTITTDESGYAIIKYNGAVSITSVTTTANYTNYADCTVISGTANTTYSVAVIGKKYEETDKVVSSYVSSSDAYDEAKLTMTLDTCNELITSQTRAKALATWYLTSLQKRKDVEFDWWSIATAEASDFINVITSYDEQAQMQISEIDYNLSDLVASVKGVME